MKTALVYVADEQRGLRIVDVSRPAAPATVGYYDSPGFAEDVAVVSTSFGRIAFVADGNRGLRIIDVSSSSSPREVGSYLTPGYAGGVAVSGNYAYVADGASGLRIIDVRNPSNPFEAGSYDTSGSALGVAVAGGYAYVADGSAGLRIISVAYPGNPTLVGSFDTPGDARGVAIAGNFAYVADYSGGLRIINVSDPTRPVEWSAFSLNKASRLAVAGSYAYVGNGPDGLAIVDVHNWSSPYQVGSSRLVTNTLGVAVAGETVYVADNGNGLFVFRFTGTGVAPSPTTIPTVTPTSVASSTPTATATATATGTATPTPTASPTAAVTLYFQPAPVWIAPSQTVTVEIWLDAGSVPIAAVDAFLDFDKDYIEIVGADGSSGGTGVFSPGSAMPQVNGNEADNENGTAKYGAGIAMSETPVPATGNFLFASVRFRGKTLTPPSSTLVTWHYSASQDDRRDTYVAGLDGNRVMASSIPATVNVANAALSGRVELQARGAAPDPRWILPVTVTLHSSGNATPAHLFTPTLDPAGLFTVTGITPGRYDINVKKAHTLTNRRRDILLDAGINLLDLGVLLEGNVNEDGRIDSLDYAPLASSYFKLRGDDGFDARADFNDDGRVNAADYAPFAANYFKTSGTE